MKKILDATPTVLEIKDLHFEGNVIPHNWYAHIKNKSGASDLLAITLLSEIVYWYRLMPVYDKEKDVLLGYKKKFNKDKLQKQTKELAEKFGFSEQSTNNALKRLVKLGLITREFRDITLQNGIVIQKRQFIDIVPKNIILISTIQERCTTKLHTLDKKVVEGVQESYPYTCITSETTFKENKNTCSLNSKKSISKTSTTQSVNENGFPVESEDSGRALKSKESKSSDNSNKNIDNTEKRTETPRKSTNASKDKDLYQDLIKSIVERVNDISKKSYKIDSNDSQKLIPKCLDIFKKSELKDGSALEKIYKMLKLKWSHTDKDSEIYFTRAYFRISTLFAKANFEKYLGELEEYEQEKAQKAEQRKQAPNSSFNWNII